MLRMVQYRRNRGSSTNELNDQFRFARNTLLLVENRRW